MPYELAPCVSSRVCHRFDLVFHARWQSFQRDRTPHGLDVLGDDCVVVGPFLDEETLPLAAFLLRISLDFHGEGALGKEAQLMLGLFDLKAVDLDLAFGVPDVLVLRLGGVGVVGFLRSCVICRLTDIPRQEKSEGRGFFDILTSWK